MITWQARRRISTNKFKSQPKINMSGVAFIADLNQIHEKNITMKLENKRKLAGSQHVEIQTTSSNNTMKIVSLILPFNF